MDRETDLEEENANDDDTYDRVAIWYIELVRFDGHPNAHTEGGEGEDVGKDLPAGMEPDLAFEGAEDDGAKWKEKSKGEAHHDAMGHDHFFVVCRHLGAALWRSLRTSLHLGIGSDC